MVSYLNHDLSRSAMKKYIHLITISSFCFLFSCNGKTNAFDSYVFYDGFDAYNAYGKKINTLIGDTIENEGIKYYKCDRSTENSIVYDGKAYIAFEAQNPIAEGYWEKYCLISYDYETAELKKEIIGCNNMRSKRARFGLPFGNSLPFIYYEGEAERAYWHEGDYWWGSTDEKKYPLTQTDQYSYYIDFEYEKTQITYLNKNLTNQRFGSGFFFIHLSGGSRIEDRLLNYVEKGIRYSGFSVEEESPNPTFYLQPNSGFWSDNIFKIDIKHGIFEIIEGPFCFSNTLPKLSNIKDYSLHRRYQECSPKYVYRKTGETGRIMDFSGVDFELDLSMLSPYTEFAGAFNYIESINSLFFEVKDPVSGKSADAIMNLDDKIPHFTPIGWAHKGFKGKDQPLEFKVFEDEDYGFYSIREPGIAKFVARNKRNGLETVLQKKWIGRTHSFTFENEANRFGFDFMYDHVDKTE